MKGNLKLALLAIGIMVVFFIMGRDIIETRIKLGKIRDQVIQAQKEKEYFRDELKTVKTVLIKTNRDLKTASSKLEFINRKVIGLKSSNSKLTAEKRGLEHKIALLREEKKTIEARLHSLRELKKAIRQVKLEIRDDKIRWREERIRQQKEMDKWKTAMGNRGFLTKDGELFYKPKVSVEVRPANISLNKK